MAGPYLVQMDPVNCSPGKVGGADTVVLYAESAAQARQGAAARFGVGGEANGAWTNSGNVATALAAPSLNGLVFAIHIEDGGSDIDVSVTADADDTVADVAAKLVTALNATAINGAAYAAPTLTIAETTDALGDLQVTATVTQTINGQAFDLSASFLDNLVDGGAEADALSVDLLAGSALGILAGLKIV